MARLEVVSPLVLEAGEPAAAAPRLDTLEGKTIGEFWNGVFKGNETFPVIRRLLEQKFPGVRIVPFTEFPHGTGSDHPAHQRELARKMAALAREKGCHAVISGNGA